LPAGGAMKLKQHGSDYFWLLFAAANFILLLAVVVLGFASLIYSLELTLMVGAPLMLRSMGDTVQAKYALVTLRNIWMLAGGIFVLVIVIYSINTFFKRWREMRLQRVFLVALAVEALIILSAQLLANS
jgi:hypothetical protein